LREWLGRDPIGAAEFCRSMEVPELRTESLRRVLQIWAERNPVSALDWAAKLTDSLEAETAMLNVCAQVAERDPRQAIQLVTDYRLDQSAVGLLGNFAAQWAVRDFSGAYNWASGHPAGPIRDDMLARIAVVQSKSDPAGAARMVVEQLGQTDKQIEAVISVVHQWALQDLDSASAWVAVFPEGLARDRAVGELEGILHYRFNMPP
jgi:hypothetical protein